MAVINILSQHVADMIAAGEVVERPGSVVKELMENALDAGAKSITVELRGGGATFIRVTDDGCGMAPEDAGNCFLRHATSKLRDEHGLEAISTMGFRGEALAAISAVSRVELITRREEDDEGTYVFVEGGDIVEMRPAGGPKGTSFTVRDLFYNTPARLKFLKSDRAESAWCVSLALRVALGRPDISVRCLRDGREEFFTAGDGKPASAVYALLGRDTALSMLPVENENEGVRVTGFVSSPAAGRGSRATQHFFVNGRAIRSQTLQAAVEQAYKNTLLVGRFPACVLYIELNPGAVDVNVHPTKSEVKFFGEKKVFDAVYYGALGAVKAERKPLEMELSSGTIKRLEPTPPPPKPSASSGATLTFRSPAVIWEREETPQPAPVRHAVYSAPEEKPRYTYPAPAPKQSPAPYVPATASASPSVSAPDPAPPPVSSPKPSPAPTPTPAPEPEQQSLFREGDTQKPLSARLVGEVMRTYIIAEQGDAMLLIDKHAAHERMNFDRLKAQGRSVMSQTLLAPAVWHPEPEAREAVMQNAALLEELGFSLEPFGEDDVLIRGVPDAMDPAQATAALEEIAEKLRRGRQDLMRDEILQTVACKSAIKAGWDTDPRELQVLVDKVAAGEIKYCPHGRPVAVRLTRKELDKQFKRIV